MRRWWVVFALAAIAGCDCGTGGGGDPMPDAGVDASVVLFDGAPAVPAAPGDVQLPVMTPCPSGWHERADEIAGVVTCDPWPEGGPPDCAEGMAFYPGATECMQIGEACPAGDFAEGLPDTGVVYVRAGATGGDGTRALPFGTIAEATAIAAGGETIALAKGEYDEVVHLRGGVILRGACATETVVRSSAATGARAVIEVEGGATVVRDLGIGPSVLFGVNVTGIGRSVELRGVIITSTRTGVFAFASGAVRVDGAIIRSSNGSRVAVGGWGYGFDIESRATLEATRVILERNETAVFVGGTGATVTLTDSAVRDGVKPIGADALGIYTIAGGQTTLARVVVERVVAGALAREVGTTIEVDHVVVRDSVPSAEGVAAGISAENGATIRGRRLLVERAMMNGARAHNGTLELEDVVVRDTESDLARQFGDGIHLQMASQGRITRSALLRNRYAGATAVGETTHLELEHATVADTRERPEGAFGMGLYAVIGGRVTARFATLVRNRSAGIWAMEGGSIVAEDVTIADTRGSALDGTQGNAVIAQGRIELTRAVLRGNREVAIAVGYEGDATLEDVVVERTLPRECAETSCAANRGGVGLAAYSGGRATADRFEIRDFPLCGAAIQGGGELDLTDGRVAGGELGACVEDPGYDLGRLTRRVRFEDVDVPIVTRDLMIPEPPTP